MVTDVTDYYYISATARFRPRPAGACESDFKQVELTVTWNTAREFQIDENHDTSGAWERQHQSTRCDFVHHLTVQRQSGLGTGGDTCTAPRLITTRAPIPDIISIQLGANKFKESTTPLPDVIRTDELVETTFDVVTYSQDDSGATFLRREEFRAVSCECTLRAPDG